MPKQCCFDISTEKGNFKKTANQSDPIEHIYLGIIIQMVWDKTEEYFSIGVLFHFKNNTKPLNTF